MDQEHLDADGRPLTPPSLARPTYTWRRDDAGWRIVAGQNTAVAPDPPDAEADLAALREVVQHVEDGFNGNDFNGDDVELLTADVADDAVLVDAAGRVLRGREEAVAAALPAHRSGPDPRNAEGRPEHSAPAGPGTCWHGPRRGWHDPLLLSPRELGRSLAGGASVSRG
ncbi:hypothetical protein [Geodermatophilus sp. SYSU D00815]